VSEELVAKWLDDRASLSEEEALGLARVLNADPALAAQMKDQLAVAELLSRGKAVDRANFESQVAQRIAGGGAAFTQSTLDAVDQRVRSERRRISWKEAVIAASLLIGLLVLLLRHENPPVVVPAAPAHGAGLQGEYFRNQRLKNPAANRLDPKLDFTWRPGAGPFTGWNDEFSVRWTGKITPRYTGKYTFHTQSDDGVRVWIDGKPIINDWNGRPVVVDNRGEIELEAGKPVAIKVEYFNGGDIGVLRLYWSSASQPEEIVPSSQLSPE
jgi:hypothetical protein